VESKSVTQKCDRLAVDKPACTGAKVEQIVEQSRDCVYASLANELQAKTKARLARQLQSAFDLVAQKANANRPFQLQKGSESVFRVHDETLPVIAMCVGNPDRSPLAIQS
jgi:hypothetical protein